MKLTTTLIFLSLCFTCLSQSRDSISNGKVYFLQNKSVVAIYDSKGEMFKSKAVVPGMKLLAANLTIDAVMTQCLYNEPPFMIKDSVEKRTNIYWNLAQKAKIVLNGGYKEKEIVEWVKWRLKK